MVGTNGTVRHRGGARFIAEGVEGIGLGLVVTLTWPGTRRVLRNWGSSPEERAGVWPGDALVGPEHSTYTRGITIAGSRADIWPWLVQFGLGRAGFYSYELLERIVGIPVRNVESVVPELQDLSVGDEILLHPKAPGIPVAAVEEGDHICFGQLQPTDPATAGSDPARSWSMYVVAGSNGTSRLLLRGCLEPRRSPTLSQRGAELLEEPIDFLMEQRMLRTIKRLVESGRGSASFS